MVLNNSSLSRTSSENTTISRNRNVESRMDNELAKYHEDYLKKKEGKKKWPEFWVVLEENWLKFYKDRGNVDKDNYRGCVEVTSDAKCVIGKRKTYSFPFVLMTKKGNHLFKCDTTLQRHKWMYALGLASRRSPPTEIPSYIMPQNKPTEDGVYVGDWDTNVSSEHKERSSDEEDEVLSDDDHADIDDDVDNDVVPAGILIVTEPLDSSGDELDGNYVHNRSSFGDFCAVNTTGLGGITRVTQSSKEQRPKLVHPAVVTPTKTTSMSLLQRHKRSSLPKLGRTTWTSHDEERPRRSPFFNHSKTFLSASRDLRPNSSPELGSKTKLSRDPLGTPLTTGLQSSAHLNAHFSRHLVKSTPNLHMKVEEL